MSDTYLLKGEDDVNPAAGEGAVGRRGMIHVTLSEDGKPGILRVDVRGSSEHPGISEELRDLGEEQELTSNKLALSSSLIL